MRAASARGLLAAGVVFTLGGCVSIAPDNGKLACSTDGQCPPGYSCAADDFCWLDGTGPEAGSPGGGDGPVSLDGAGGGDGPGADLGGDLRAADLRLPGDLPVTDLPRGDLAGGRDLRGVPVPDLFGHDGAPVVPDLAIPVAVDLAGVTFDLEPRAADLSGCDAPGCCNDDSDCGRPLVCNRATHTCIVAGSCTSDGDCVFANGTAACVSGSCNGSCPGSFKDCNGVYGDGCETDTSVSATSCGSCGNVCSSNHLTPSCGAGQCNGTCLPGYADCNSDLADDGCETDLLTDSQRCGGCGLPCTSPETCVGGHCSSAVCTAPQADCDGSPGNGCEANLDGDLANCGSCGRACSTINVTGVQCAGGQCSGGCASGFADCNNDLRDDGCETDVVTGVNNCGGCGLGCSTNHTAFVGCSNGSCSVSCLTGYDNCDGSLRQNGCNDYLPSDYANCGACGRACSSDHILYPTGSCGNGTCYGSCEPGWSDCNGNLQADGCEASTDSDPQNCGSCGRACAGPGVGSSTCVGGQCMEQCATGYSDCNGDILSDGCEVMSSFDPSNCGGCGVVCSMSHVLASCIFSSCTGTCDSGFADCNGSLQVDGCETDIADDITNCGGCGIGCSGNHVRPVCSGGTCTGQCDTGFADCNNDPADGCEQDLANSPLDCGYCGNSCYVNNADVSCLRGQCSARCNPGYADCNVNLAQDGCEDYVDADNAHCGACGNAACDTTSTQCLHGACLKLPGQVCTSDAECFNGSCVCAGPCTYKICQ